MSPQITTYSRKFFDITHPDPASICIEDIAHALSLICRGNGHVMTFYSVGQHCLQCAKEAMARQLPTRLVLAALLHDATECYMSDVPRPMKQLMPIYRHAFIVAGLRENQAFVMAEGYGEGDDFQSCAEAFDGLVVGCDAKGNDAAKAVLHLFLGQFMTGMAGQAGIGNEGDVLPLFQPFGDFLRRCVDAFHPQGEGHGTAENLPGIEGADDRADVDLGFIADPVHRCQIIGNDGPALGIAMAVDIFRQRFDDEIGSQVQWSLVERRCKGIVDGQDSPVFMSDFGDGFDI